MAKGSVRRARVIKAMIAFVAILAVLTFFSNTIMNMTIPKVLGSYASRGNLSYSNSARGTITVDNQVEIKGLDGRTVDEIKVTNYDPVKKGDTVNNYKVLAIARPIPPVAPVIKAVFEDKSNIITPLFISLV